LNFKNTTVDKTDMFDDWLNYFCNDENDILVVQTSWVSRNNI